MRLCNEGPYCTCSYKEDFVFTFERASIIVARCRIVSDESVPGDEEYRHVAQYKKHTMGTETVVSSECAARRSTDVAS